MNETGKFLSSATLSFRVPANGHVKFWTKRTSTSTTNTRQVGWIMPEHGTSIYESLFDGSFNDSDWVLYEKDISFLSGKNVRLYFAEISEGTVEPQIIYIDDVEITGEDNSSGTISNYEYWIDDLIGGRVSVNTTNNEGAFNLDGEINMASVSDGFHTLNCRFRDENDAWSPVSSSAFYKKSVSGLAAYEYWFDGNYQQKTNTTSTENGLSNLMVSIDAGTLSEGIHTLNFRFRDKTDWSPVASKHFLKFSGSEEAFEYECWYDRAVSLKQKVTADVSSEQPLMVEFDFTGLSKGYHTFNIRFRDSAGWGPVSTHMFFKGAGFTQGWAGYQYWVDTLPHPVFQDVSVSDSMLHSVQFEIEGNNYENGEHMVHTRFFDRKGTYSPVLSMPIAIGMPVANAGDDFEVTKNSFVSLDGSNSYDTNGDELCYSWGSPAEIILDDSTRMNPGFISPNVIEDQLYMFTLTVSDGFYVSDPDTVYIRVLNATTPETQHLTNRVFISGENHCFNALQTITLAGGGTTVVFENGSTATLIAGQSIRFLPGFHAQFGSWMDAHITTTGTFCDVSPAPIVAQPETKSKEQRSETKPKTLVVTQKLVKVYPNPNNGRFTVELMNFENAIVSVYSISGVKLLQLNATNPGTLPINLPNLINGIYFLKVNDNEKQHVTKFVVN